MNNFEFPVEVKNGTKKRIADVNIKQFQAEEFNISSKDITYQRNILATGTDFTLHEGEYRGSSVAVKIVTIPNNSTKEYMNTLVDLTAMADLPHENIAAFYGAGHAQNAETGNLEIMIVLEAFEKGTLRHVIKTSPPWEMKLSIARDIARAMAYLHSKYMIHGDIRTSNILINEQNQAKIVDFSHMCGEESRLDIRTYNNTKGTVSLSPEIAKSQLYNAAADIYAYGILLFELITEKAPSKQFRYRSTNSGFVLLNNELRSAVKSGCPAELEALAFSCCETKPNQRPDADQIVEELDFIILALNRIDHTNKDVNSSESPLQSTKLSTTTTMNASSINSSTQITSPVRTPSKNRYAHLLLPSPPSWKGSFKGPSSAEKIEVSTPPPSTSRSDVSSSLSRSGSLRQVLEMAAVVEEEGSSSSEGEQGEEKVGWKSIQQPVVVVESTAGTLSNDMGDINDKVRSSVQEVTAVTTKLPTVTDTVSNPLVHTSSQKKSNRNTDQTSTESHTAEIVPSSARDANTSAATISSLFPAVTVPASPGPSRTKAQSSLKPAIPLLPPPPSPSQRAPRASQNLERRAAARSPVNILSSKTTENVAASPINTSPNAATTSSSTSPNAQPPSTEADSNNHAYQPPRKPVDARGIANIPAAISKDRDFTGENAALELIMDIRGIVTKALTPSPTESLTAARLTPPPSPERRRPVGSKPAEITTTEAKTLLPINSHSQPVNIATKMNKSETSVDTVEKIVEKPRKRRGKVDSSEVIAAAEAAIEASCTTNPERVLDTVNAVAADATLPTTSAITATAVDKTNTSNSRTTHVVRTVSDITVVPVQSPPSIIVHTPPISENKLDASTVVVLKDTLTNTAVVEPLLIESSTISPVDSVPQPTADTDIPVSTSSETGKSATNEKIKEVGVVHDMQLNNGDDQHKEDVDVLIITSPSHSIQSPPQQSDDGGVQLSILQCEVQPQQQHEENEDQPEALLDVAHEVITAITPNQSLLEGSLSNETCYVPEVDGLIGFDHDVSSKIEQTPLLNETVISESPMVDTTIKHSDEEAVASGSTIATDNQTDLPLSAAPTSTEKLKRSRGKRNKPKQNTKEPTEVETTEQKDVAVSAILGLDSTPGTTSPTTAPVVPPLPVLIQTGSTTSLSVPAPNNTGSAVPQAGSSSIKKAPSATSPKKGVINSTPKKGLNHPTTTSSSTVKGLNDSTQKGLNDSVQKGLNDSPQKGLTNSTSSSPEKGLTKQEKRKARRKKASIAAAVTAAADVDSKIDIIHEAINIDKKELCSEVDVEAEEECIDTIPSSNMMEIASELTSPTETDSVSRMQSPVKQPPQYTLGAEGDEITTVTSTQNTSPSKLSTEEQKQNSAEDKTPLSQSHLITTPPLPLPAPPLRVFTDEDAKISTGKKTFSIHVPPRSYRSPEKGNRYNLLAAAMTHYANNTHTPTTVFHTPQSSAYRTRLAALERRLQVLSKENEELHKEMQTLLLERPLEQISVNHTKAILPTDTTSSSVTNTLSTTLPDNNTVVVEPLTMLTDLEQPTPTSNTDSPIHTPVPTQDDTQSPLPAPSTAMTPTGYIEVIRYLESMQSDLRSQLSTLIDQRASSTTTGNNAMNNTPTMYEADMQQQQQHNMVAAIDTKLGAVQEQMTQFAAILNSLLAAQATAPLLRHDEMYQANSQISTQSSAFVTPSSGTAAVFDPPEGEFSAMSPCHLFEQIDQVEHNPSHVTAAATAVVVEPHAHSVIGLRDDEEVYSYVPQQQASHSCDVELPSDGNIAQEREGDVDSLRSDSITCDSSSSATKANENSEEQDDLSERLIQEHLQETPEVPEIIQEDSELSIPAVINVERPTVVPTRTSLDVEQKFSEFVDAVTTVDDNIKCKSADDLQTKVVDNNIEVEVVCSDSDSSDATVNTLVVEPEGSQERVNAITEGDITTEVLNEEVNIATASDVNIPILTGTEVLTSHPSEVVEEQAENVDQKLNNSSNNDITLLDSQEAEQQHSSEGSPTQSAESNEEVKEEFVLEVCQHIPLTSAESVSAMSSVNSLCSGDDVEVYAVMKTGGKVQDKMLRHLLAMEAALFEEGEHHTKSPAADMNNISTLQDHALGLEEATDVIKSRSTPEVLQDVKMHSGEDHSKPSTPPEASVLDTQNSVHDEDSVSIDVTSSHHSSPAVLPSSVENTEDPEQPPLEERPSESSSMIDTCDIEPPYTMEEWEQRHHSRPATMLAMHRYQEEQQKQALLQQQQMLEAELADSYYASHHPPPLPRLTGVTMSSITAAQTDEPHHHAMLPQANPTTPSEKVFASSWKFLEEIDKLKTHMDNSQHRDQPGNHAQEYTERASDRLTPPQRKYTPPRSRDTSPSGYNYTHPYTQNISHNSSGLPYSSSPTYLHNTSAASVSTAAATATRRIDQVTPQRLVDLTGALSSFLQVIEKCEAISQSADRAVSSLDQSMSQLNTSTASHYKTINPDRAPDLYRSRTAGNISVTSTPIVSNTIRNTPGQVEARLLPRTDTFYSNVEYIEEYDDSEEEATGRSVSHSISHSTSQNRLRSRTDSNVFDSTSNLPREPVHTKHFLSPSTKPALPNFNRQSHSHTNNNTTITASAVASPIKSSHRSSKNPTSSNTYFQASNTIVPGSKSPAGSVSGCSHYSRATSSKPTPSPRGNNTTPTITSSTTSHTKLPLKPALPNVFRKPTTVVTKNRTDSFASTIATSASFNSSNHHEQNFQGSGSDIPNRSPNLLYKSSFHRDEGTVYSAYTGHSGGSKVVIDGRKHTIRTSRSPSREYSEHHTPIATGTTSSNSNLVHTDSFSSPSSRSRSRSPLRQPSPKEIQSKYTNSTTYSFRTENEPRKIS